MTFDDNESCFGSQNAWFLDVTGTAGRTARAAKIVPVLWPVSHRATLCHALSSARGTWVISSSVVEASSNWPDPKVRGNWKILHFVQDDNVGLIVEPGNVGRCVLGVSSHAPTLG